VESLGSSMECAPVLSAPATSEIARAAAARKLAQLRSALLAHHISTSRSWSTLQA